MSINSKDIYFTQRNAANTAFEEVYVSGSNLIITTGPDGTITGSTELPYTITASFALTASYVLGGAISGAVDSASYANFALTASYLIGQSATASYALKAETILDGANINVGQITASSMLVEKLTVSVITSSVAYITGSTIFGSSTSDTHQFTGSVLVSGSMTVFGNITGSISSASYSVTSSANILQQSLVSNQTVGGVTSGTTFNSGSSVEAILRQLLITYIPPTISGLTVKLQGSSISTADRDVGNSFTINSASFNATLDSPNGVGPITSSWTASNADIGTVYQYFQDGPLSNGANNFSLGSVYTINRASTAGTVTFTVNARRADNNSLITPTTTNISFRFRNYMCASSTAISSNGTAQSVINNDTVVSQLDTDEAWNVTCTTANDTAGNYTYIIYPATYGDLSNIVQNGALPVLGAFTKIGDYTVTNAYGSSLSVRVYQSNSTQAFANGTTLTIT